MSKTPSSRPAAGFAIASSTGDLASTLLDLTTDYAAPVVERFGLPPAALGILQESFRPEVEYMGGDIRGAVAAELETFMHGVFTTMERAGVDVHGTARFLCSLCVGSDRWARTGVADWTQTLAAWSAPSTDGMRQLGELFDQQVTQPVGAIQAYTSSAERPWMEGRRTAWDTVAFTKAYEDLGIPPSVSMCFDRRFIRLFAAQATATLPPATLVAAYEAAQAELAVVGVYEEAAEYLLPLPVIAERSEADWQSVARGLVAAGFRPRR